MPEVDVDISQTELADLCNVSRSMLAGLLGELKREGVIEPGYGSIRILDPEALTLRLKEFT